jgi:uncharacterized membrane protein YkoI
MDKTKSFRSLALAALAATAFLVGAPMASAQGNNSPFTRFTAPESRDATRSGQVVPLSSVTAQLRARFGGRLINSQLVDRGNQPVYMIRWETEDGSLIDFTVDARSGAILSQQG